MFSKPRLHFVNQRNPRQRLPVHASLCTPFEKSPTMSDLTYLEAIVMGAIQGVSELFPVSSLAHSILIPAVIGGSWARDLNISAANSPYLAFVVGLHVATAAALVVFFRKDWARIIGGLVSSIRYRRVKTGPERLVWLLIIATIPVAIAGLLLEHTFRTVFGQPQVTAVFLALNGVVLLLGDRFRRRSQARAELVLVAQNGDAESTGDTRRSALAKESDDDTAIDSSIVNLGIKRGTAIGATQILALLPGISRSGVGIIAGMVAGLSHREAARFSFLLATPVILAAGVLKLPSLFGPMGHGIQGQVLAGSAASFIFALVAVGFLDRYFRTRTLTPFAIYCMVAGIAAFVIVTLR
jgi:undecaprenyl-diphosphatase